MKLLRFLAAALALLVLVGCKTELYSNLDEREANEIIAVLLEHGIECSKKPGKENKWTVYVEKSDMVAALKILENNGLPRKRFVSLGEVFKKSGLVSSPLEERARFIYALSQELASAISMIDGVISAKVFIVLPENNPFQEHVQPASASVFIKCKPDADITAEIPKIKKLVVNSIEGLTYNKVTVVPFVSAEEPVPRPPFRRLFGIKVSADSYPYLVALVVVSAISVAAILLLLGYFVVLPRLREERKGAAEGIAEEPQQG